MYVAVGQLNTETKPMIWCKLFLLLVFNKPIARLIDVCIVSFARGVTMVSKVIIFGGQRRGW